MQDGFLERIAACGVVPVVTVPDAETAVPVAQALLDGGIDVIELTLRTEAGVRAIAAIARSCPDMLVIAGTVLHPAQFAAVRDAGALASVSPGFSEALHEAAEAAGMPWLPGVATASDVMRAVGCGRTNLKFFPAELAGGVAMLRALSGPFPDTRFCPTGGVTSANLGDYLSVPSVMCVGGTWLAPAKAVTDRDWAVIRDEARTARLAVDAVRGR
ncbi:bifunctional 4-hydroxy-2-oxoglutarate aldolase/2-dehydro-3-deoxy-phosphogluconate aldolase [Chelatococcus sp. SYSU_G07232]|uniref:2-dehydro-3-deoxy-phosphogluconate aldolase n=1 Tax=Chelatococcus albus TaxID=3047466 RepID=A0ABT7ADG3_9HYPH|nr:bifunctional 4-hydroxy-2-oxoglutarate aldolase/2-dehydro-3-deoxy-phosphogluconate aldolase [Chelatococcus sp. SYSU_G07232]MDJ1157042.1 bifunctional 4-hydroxy-2-oxoglutarate aldolase/2-dehydro-3-deoxy-phosphogluconate aldolase [Chelatococcus sp. SYSU_G07232]